MDEMIINRVALTGLAPAAPVFSHESRRERFYTLPLEVERLSGSRDTLNVILRESLLPAAQHDCLRVVGELRSFNNRSGTGSRLVITVFAREIESGDGLPAENDAELFGTLCKPPAYRRTPLGREICDIMLAVNRRYGRSDYLPCIAWGENALLAQRHAVGSRLRLRGRVQSREYIKLTEAGPVKRTAFEVSAAELCFSEESPAPISSGNAP